MRPGVSRGLAGAVLVTATLLGASACTKVDLTNEWPAMAAPTGWEPQAGVCHANAFSETSYRKAYDPISCDDDHKYETVHIGTFAGDAAELDAPPERDSTAFRAAWTECDKKTTEYVGDDWRDSTIWIAVSLPSRGNWEGGARWYRCEASVTTYHVADVVSTSKSIKGDAAQLRRGCYQNPADDDKPWTPVPCDKSHNAEFVGSFISNDSWESLGKNTDSNHRKCRSLIAKYVGVPDDGRMKYRTGSSYLYPSKAEWEAGDHGVRCHLWLGDKKLTSSLKGKGTKGLPINYG